MAFLPAPIPTLGPAPGAPFLPSPAIVGPAGQNFVCLPGMVNLFRFIQPPQPGSVIGTLSTLAGARIPLVQTVPTPAGGVTLATVDGRFATVCGNLTVVGGQLVLDVRFVAQGFGPITPGVDPLTLRSLIALGI